VRHLSGVLGHRVAVRSNPGAGSVFSIDVPPGSRPAPERPPGSPAATDGAGRFAVLVDNDAIVLLGLKATLEEWGYEVLAAGSGDQALARLRASGRRPDVVVADYRLREGRTGTDAILRIREMYDTGVPGILLTGEIGAEVQDDAARHGFGIIHKPVTSRQLGVAVDDLLVK
jgi:CheY-like chemotaxis protein